MVKIKKIMLIIFFLVVLVFKAKAIPNALPTITVAFDEPVDVSTIERELTDVYGNVFELVDLEVSEDYTTFKYQPADLLDEGNYIFTITADDIYGNKGEAQIQGFSVEIDTFEISIAEPSFGVSAVSPFDLEIQTNRYGECRYAFTNATYVEMLGLFETTNNVAHSVDEFSETGDFYVRCIDYYGKEYFEKFVLVYDAVDPEINQIYVEDVFQLTDGELLTSMQVEASEEVVCKYITNDDKVEYEDMNLFFGLNENDVESYNESHEHNLSGSELIDYQTNYAYVICKDKAERFSVKTQDDFYVNTNQTPTTTINSPSSPHYTSNTTILFDITTNKDAECKFDSSDNLDDPEDYNDYQFSFGQPPRMSHTSTKTFSEGTYTYYVKCRFTETGDEPYVSTTFTIDETPPVMEYLNDSNPDLSDNAEYTYHTNKLYAEWFAYDNETGISEYNYYIYEDNQYSDDELMVSGTTSNEEEWIGGLKLNDSQKYYFKVSAKNIVGLLSSNMTSNGIIVDTSLEPAVCYDDIQNNDETDVDCGGSCSGCAVGMNCNINADCASGECVDGKCAGASCDDQIKNGLESDVDCGGSCEKCDNGKSCDVGTDCLSGNCVEGVCAEADLCSNNIKDSGEADIDCGGSCSPCAAGAGCSVNEDCVSNVCVDGKCVEAACDDETHNGDETDVDCGGSCSGCDLGSKCKVNNDCSSGVCENSVCEESKDKDSDGLPNDWEEMYGLDPENYDTDNNGISDGDEDMDNDGLINIEEYSYNTNPLKYDTDGDKYSDKVEIEAGTDPNDPNSKPRSKIWFYLLLLIILIIIGAGSYYGYKKYKEYSVEKEAKAALPKKQEKIVKGIPKPVPVKKPIIRKKELSPEEKQMLEKKRKEKKIRRKRVFEKFVPKTAKKVPEKQLKEGSVAYKKEKAVPKKIAKEEEDVFKRLAKTLPYKKKK